MSFGSPPKIDYARRLAAALGYVGIGSLDRVGVTTFAAGLSGGPAAALTPRRGRAQLFHLLEYMSGLQTSGRTDIARSLEEYARRSRSPGLAIVISDLLDDALSGYQRGLQALLFHDFEVVLVHVLDREEIAPGRGGSPAAHRHGDGPDPSPVRGPLPAGGLPGEGRQLLPRRGIVLPAEPHRVPAHRHDRSVRRRRASLPPAGRAPALRGKP